MTLIVAISGKRKSGKDYCSAFLKKILSQRLKVCLTGISNSLKEEYARLNGLDLDQLLSNGPYKETYRKDMISWGEELRNQDPSVFCRSTIPPSDVDVLIISDCRRRTDLEYFATKGRPLITVRIECNVEERRRRGFKFTEGIDDAESECGLDDVEFDFVIRNDGEEAVDVLLNDLIGVVTSSLDSHLNKI